MSQTGTHPEWDRGWEDGYDEGFAAAVSRHVLPLNKITSRERDTILAALRLWQRDGNSAPGEIVEIANNGIVDNELTDEEIDALCERINR